MSFKLEMMMDIKQEEISEMKSICQKIKTRKRKHYSIRDTLIDKINIITELKHSSPSAGKLSGELNDSEIVQRYIRGGASAISVLTEKKYFNGSYAHLQTAASLCDKPVLCKDFIYFEEQVEAAYLCGADMVLLISAALDKNTMLRLFEKVKSFNMTPLVEIHDESEIDNILYLNPEFVLVNMRNLKTLKIKFLNGINTLKKLPPSITRISASGIESRDDISRIMYESGTNNFLIGSSLMKSGDPEKMLKEFKNVY
jgi:indole-3-glycerol phosphate synthase